MEDKSFKDLIEGIDSPLADNTEKTVAEPEVEKAPVMSSETQPVEENAESTPICIVDETTTTFVMEEATEEPTAEPVEEAAPKKAKKEKKAPKQKKQKKAKKAKRPNNGKLNALQIVLICLAAIIALWVSMYTVDHVLASNGISPLFCKLTAEYEDGSASYKGLGYKVQFKFDDNGNLTQRVLPAWKDGPNDINTAE